MSISVEQPWGPPSSPIVANLFMEDFEVKAINTTKNPPKMLKRYVDDTCVILNSTTKEEFFHHINSIDPRIQFTSKDSKPDGSIPFLDSLVMPQPDGSIKTTVFRKPTHTDMYLHWDSYHHLSAKYSVINTLRHRAKTVCSTKQLLTEEDHLYNALRRCKYHLWAWNRVNIKKKQKRNNQGNNNNNTKKPYFVVPYMKGLGETCKKHLQETWSGDVLQRRKHHQRSTGTSQGQRHHTQEKWGDIHVQMVEL